MNEDYLLFPIQACIAAVGQKKPFGFLTIMKEKVVRDKGPLVAIDIGSSAIRAMAAEVNENGTLRILGVEEIQKTRALEKGVIVNSTEVGGGIRQILTLLRNRINMRSDENIQYAFVSVGGNMLQSTMVQASRDLLAHNYIPNKKFQDMETECREKIENKYPMLKVFSLEPILYILDDEAQTYYPTEFQKARKITVQYIAFVCQKEALERVQGSCDRAATGIESTFARPETHLWALCNDDDTEAGVAIIDLGYQTTTLSIYKENAFRQTYVVPLGGYHITRDIQDQQISMQHAEMAKQRFGSAMEEKITKTQMLNIRQEKNPDEKVQLSTALLARIIGARLEEILAPIMQRLRTFQASETLGKIYLTGGGAMLRDIIPFVQQYTSLPVLYGSHADWLDEETEDRFYQPNYSALIGTLILGNEYRKEHIEEEQPQVPFVRSWVDEMKRKTIDLFSGENQ